MSKEKKMCSTFLVAAILFAMAIVPSVASAQTEKVIHQFALTDGADPNGALLIDSAGNIYGATATGGTSTACESGCGVVFEISPISGGGSHYRVIHEFASGDDGATPRTSLSMDASGRIYGTTMYGGGSTSEDCPTGCGTVFVLTPSSNGVWKESILHHFEAITDGRVPIDGVSIDAAGNLYGVTEFSLNSTGYIGQVYEISPNGTKWTFKTLHNFLPATDGYYPLGSVVLDSEGNLYGTTQFGAESAGCYNQGCGIIYELSPGSNGTWTESILYEFPSLDGPDGSIPSGRITRDAEGNIYGTTEYGGENASACPQSGCGTAFKLSNVAGTWQLTTLHSFGQGADGREPIGPVTLDSAGNVYGTTQYGGSSGRGTSWGNVFELSPNAGNYTYKSLHVFNNVAGGQIPWAGVTLDAQGDLWGTTFYGGSSNGDGYGVVFELKAP